MAKLSQRFFALFFAILFLVTSSSIAIAFILSNIQSKNKNNQTASNTASQTQASNTTTSTTKLAGTKLANFTPVASVSSLQTTDTTVGTGTTVKAGDTVSVDYTGAVAATGLIFQSSLDTGKPVSLSLSQVIAGWSQGIPGMKVGGTRRLLIPPNLAYGASPPQGSGIPANAALVFDVTVHSIQ